MPYVKIVVLTVLATTWILSSHAAQRSAVTVICDAWPPYQLMVDGRVNGFSTRVVRIVFERMGVPFANIHVYPWKRAISMMERGETDALYSANLTPQRLQFAFYPDEPIVRSSWVMWVREGENLRFESLQDLAGKRVGVVRGYSYTPAFRRFVAERAVVEEVATDQQNFQKLRDGRLDYVAAELQSGRYIVQHLGLEAIRPLTDNPLKRDGLYIIFNRDNVRPSFVQAFSDELKKFKNDPEYTALIARHLRF